MKTVYLIYNNATKRFILNPYRSKFREEYDDLDSALESLDQKRKIKLYTNIPEIVEKERYKNIVDIVKVK